MKELVQLGPLEMPLWAVLTVAVILFATVVLSALIRVVRWFRQRTAAVVAREKKFTEFDPEGLRLMAPEPVVGATYRIGSDFCRVTGIDAGGIWYEFRPEVRDSEFFRMMVDSRKVWALVMVGAVRVKDDEPSASAEAESVELTNELPDGIPEAPEGMQWVCVESRSYVSDDHFDMAKNYRLVRACDAAAVKMIPSSIDSRPAAAGAPHKVGGFRGVWNWPKNAIRDPLNNPKVGDVFGEKYIQTFGSNAGKETEFMYYVHAVLADWIIASFGEEISGGGECGRAYPKANWFEAVKKDKLYVKKKAD